MFYSRQLQVRGSQLQRKMSPTSTFVLLFLSCAALCHSRSIEDSEVYDDGSLEQLDIAYQAGWPSRGLKVGQVSGVSYQTDGKAVVFHRGSRTWEEDDFGEDGVYTKASEGKIKEDTIAVVDENGNMVDSWGADMFYLPHGLTVDCHNNLWVTDVAAQQVHKFAAGSKVPTLTIGEALKPGSDAGHFCQPTDVAVVSNGDFFVADGYCNSRIVKFDRNGKMLKEFGKPTVSESRPKPGELNVPHSLALIESDDIVCAADRENQRVQCFNAGLKNASRTGEYMGEYSDRSLGRIFAIAYDKTDSLVHGLSVSDDGSFGFTVAVQQDAEPKMVATWGPRRGFNEPHDIAVSPNGEFILVGQLNGKRLQRYTKNS